MDGKWMEKREVVGISMAVVVGGWDFDGCCCGGLGWVLGLDDLGRNISQTPSTMREGERWRGLKVWVRR